MHRPFESIEDIPAAFRSDVAFVGAWIPGERRAEFMLSLTRQGIPLSIWGNAWQKSPNWRQIKRFWRGPSRCVKYISRLCKDQRLPLGCFQKVTGTFIPDGARRSPTRVVCFVRSAPVSVYQCIKKARRQSFGITPKNAQRRVIHCADTDLRERIRSNGHARALKGTFGNETVLNDIVQRVMALSSVNPTPDGRTDSSGQLGHTSIKPEWRCTAMTRAAVRRRSQ